MLIITVFNFYSTPCNLWSCKAHFIKFSFKVGYSGWESNPGVQSGNLARNLLGHSDSLLWIFFEPYAYSALESKHNKTSGSPTEFNIVFLQNALKLYALVREDSSIERYLIGSYLLRSLFAVTIMNDEEKKKY